MWGAVSGQRSRKLEMFQGCQVHRASEELVVPWVGMSAWGQEKAVGMHE